MNDCIIFLHPRHFNPDTFIQFNGCIIIILFHYVHIIIEIFLKTEKKIHNNIGVLHKVLTKIVDGQSRRDGLFEKINVIVSTMTCLKTKNSNVMFIDSSCSQMQIYLCIHPTVSM